MMAVAVDPQFESNHFIYVYYTWVKNGVRVRQREHPGQPRVALRAARRRHGRPGRRDGADRQHPGAAGYHIGADLQFGKDGLLYVSTGDGGCDYAGDSGCLELNDAARDQHVLLAKILRITRDGAIPAGQPVAGQPAPRAAT